MRPIAARVCALSNGARFGVGLRCSLGGAGLAPRGARGLGTMTMRERSSPGCCCCCPATPGPRPSAAGWTKPAGHRSRKWPRTGTGRAPSAPTRNATSCPPQQRQAAEQRVADSEAKARRAGARPACGGSVKCKATPRGRHPSPARSGPTEVVSGATDCPTWWRIYDESVECFGPYRTTRGATKVEAFDKCNVIASPEPRCGPRSH